MEAHGAFVQANETLVQVSGFVCVGKELKIVSGSNVIRADC